MRRLAPVAATLSAAVLYVLACPPHDFWWLAWLAPGLLLAPTRDLSPGRAFACGTAFGVLIGLGITHWAFHASLEYFALNRAVTAAFVLVVWLWCAGLPYGLLAAAYAAAARRAPRHALPALGAWLWAVLEIFRSHQLAGMPWELLGHTQWENLRLIQISDLGGMYAVSFVVAYVSLSAAELVREVAERSPGGRSLVRWAAPPACLLAAVQAYGAEALALHRLSSGAPGAAQVAIVQGNVANAFRWRRAHSERTLATYAAMTSRLTDERALALIVWPENAVDFYIDGEPMLAAQLRDTARYAGADLLVGAPRLAGEGRVHNSAYLIGASGRIAGVYDKRRLVPFGESSPLAALGARSAEALVYAPGTGASPLSTERFRVGAAICYEILFPDLVRDSVRRGADLLVNLSNDSWMDAGDGVAPRQHLSMAVFRAVETRRFLVRAATTGISGFVSPAGEIDSPLPAGTRAVGVATLAPRHEQTVYVRWGDAWLLVGAIGAALAVARPRKGGGE